jgi:hypothetical protein
MDRRRQCSFDALGEEHKLGMGNSEPQSKKLAGVDAGEKHGSRTPITQ